MTVGELIAELQKLPPGQKVYRHDSEYGPEPVERVTVEPAQSIPGYPAGRVYEFPEMIVIS